MHVTLRFLGDVDPTRVDALSAALATHAPPVEAAARAAGLPLDPRPLRPHLTLARVARVAPRATRAERRALAVARLDPPPTHPTRLRELVLFHSHLGAQPRYEPLARVR